jgi:hypothetical protein
VGDFRYSTPDSWSGKRGVAGNSRACAAGASARFVVTALWRAASDTRALYEDAENRIDEPFELWADRACSTTTAAASRIMVYSDR